MNQEIKILPFCYGSGYGGGENCGVCGHKVSCIDEAAGWGMGTLAQDMNNFESVYESLTAKFTDEELDILEEMIDCGAYIASDSEDYLLERGLMVSRNQIEAEMRMEEKQKEHFHQLAISHPGVYRTYWQILTSIEPRNVMSN